jgi:hypothetical protein
MLANRDKQIAEQRTLLERFNALASQEAAVADAAKPPLDAGEYLTGTNEAVVNADLQTLTLTGNNPVGAIVARSILCPQARSQPPAPCVQRSSRSAGGHARHAKRH